MGDDILKDHSESEVQGWYERLARKVSADSKGQGVAEPMSGLFLLQYLGKNKNSLGDTLELNAPEHLKADDSVIDVLAFHRAVFLTEKKGRFKPAPDHWAGLIPRLQSGKWDGNSQVRLEYNSLSDVAPNAFAIAKLYASKPAKKWDIFTSLRGWQLKSSVQVGGTRGKDGRVAVTFVFWTASGEDLYDFDKNEHLTLPNPDYLSMASYAIEPRKKELTVYHKNAFRLENAKPPLAKPFKVRIRPWIVRDQAVLAPATIDPKKDLS